MQIKINIYDLLAVIAERQIELLRLAENEKEDRRLSRGVRFQQMSVDADGTQRVT